TREGYDVRRHALVAFGGAAPQHAAAVADTLGISRVIIHAHAAVLSAYGIGCAAVKRMQQRTVLLRCDAASYNQLREAVDALAQQTRSLLADEGVPQSRQDQP